MVLCGGLGNCDDLDCSLHFSGYVCGRWCGRADVQSWPRLWPSYFESVGSD
jgi:hypothetical protein